MLCSAKAGLQNLPVYKKVENSSLFVLICCQSLSDFFKPQRQNKLRITTTQPIWQMRKKVSVIDVIILFTFFIAIGNSNVQIEYDLIFLSYSVDLLSNVSRILLFSKQRQLTRRCYRMLSNQAIAFFLVERKLV